MKKVLVIAIMMVACVAMAAESYDFQVGGSPELDLTNISGNIDVEAGNGGEIVVEYTKKDDRYEIDMQQDGDRVIIKVEVPEGVRNLKGGVHFTVRFPSEGALDITSVSGNIGVEDIAGSLRLKSVSGNVKLNNSGGNLKVESVSGDVILNGIAASDVDASVVSGNVEFSGMINDGRYDFNSISGNVELYYTSGSSFELDGRTVSGGIKVSDDDLRVKRPKYGPGASVKGSVNGNGARIDANTVSGKIVVKPAQ